MTAPRRDAVAERIAGALFGAGGGLEFMDDATPDIAVTHADGHEHGGYGWRCDTCLAHSSELYINRALARRAGESEHRACYS